MAKLNSVPLYPINLSAGGIPVNLCKNKTPEGKFQIARVLKPGGPQEGEFEVLYEGDESGADAFARQQVVRSIRVCRELVPLALRNCQDKKCRSLGDSRGSLSKTPKHAKA
jgi:hypothetical protein